MTWGRTVLCAFDVYESVRAAYPRRKVVPEARADSGCMYYWNGRGQMRCVSWHDKIKRIYFDISIT